MTPGTIKTDPIIPSSPYIPPYLSSLHISLSLSLSLSLKKHEAEQRLMTDASK